RERSVRNSSLPRAISSPLKNNIVFSSGTQGCGMHRASKVSRLKGLPNEGMDALGGIPPFKGILALVSTGGFSAGGIMGNSAAAVARNWARNRAGLDLPA